MSDVLALEGREPAEVLSDRLERLSQLGLSEAERGLVRALFALHPAERGQRQEAASLLKVATALLQGLASTQPIIVALEDAQHLRDHEIALLGATMEATAQAPILWIITSRGPAPPGLGQAHAGILVGPLTDAQQHELVCELLPDGLGEARAVGPALSALLARTTQGNPLYVEAVVDALLRAERLTLRQGVAVLADPEREVRLPPGLEPLLAARVDALPAPLKDALQVAAIIGINLSPALLAASLGLDSAQPLLEELDRRGLVHLPADGAEGRCTFASALVWEAVLHSILDLRRRDLHRRVAEGLGRLHAANLDGAREALARHHAGAGAFMDAATHIDRAGDLLRAQQLMREAGTCWDRAVGWLGAARRSGSRPAPPIDLEAVIRIRPAPPGPWPASRSGLSCTCRWRWSWPRRGPPPRSSPGPSWSWVGSTGPRAARSWPASTWNWPCRGRWTPRKAAGRPSGPRR